MKKELEEDIEDLPSEVDFSSGVRGKYTGSVEPLNNLVLIEPDVFASFPSAEAVSFKGRRDQAKAS
jgi:hypothetical protein